MAAMSDVGPLSTVDPEPLAEVPAASRPLGPRLVHGAKLSLAGLVALVLTYLVVRYLLSEWWVTWVSDRVHNGHGRGLRWGFVLGFVPALLVLCFLRLALMRAMPGSGRIAFVLLAATASLPLLLTLAVRAGRHGSGVPSRQIRLLEDHAPWFISSQLAGATFGALAGLAIIVLRVRRHRRQRAAHAPAPAPPSLSG